MPPAFDYDRDDAYDPDLKYVPITPEQLSRGLDEQERACDEEVLRPGSEPMVYAESLLKICEFYVESPLTCVSGVTNPNLKEREGRIMRNQTGETLNRWRKFALITFFIAALATPIVVGMVSAATIHSQTSETPAPPAPSSGEPRAGDFWVNPKDGLTYVGIPAGSFRMGCTKGDNECYQNEKNDHDVTLTHGFWMGQTEVTFEAYGKKTYPPATRDQYSGRAKVGPQYPVFSVTWEDAVDYCRWSLGSRGGLPTEAQWEYAARSKAQDSPRYGPLADIAWVDSGNRTQTSHEVKQRRPNAWGLYDMLGNVWEWTNDWYIKDYPKTAQTDPKGPGSGTIRVVRGGGWVFVGRGARASTRDTDAAPGDRVVDIGFRCVWGSDLP